MVHLGWKPAFGGLLVVLFVALLITRLARSVPPYHPPAERAPGTWGSLDRETAERLQATLDNDLNLLEAPGLQAFVRTPGGETWSGTSGTVDLRRKTPLRREHTLRVGSITKTFTALLILQLVEEGHLSLDDPLAKWFPDLPNARAITVRQLLNHTSGLPEYLPKIVMKSIIPSTYWTPQALVELAVKDKPLFMPGTGWSYSNANYVLLGLIAEKVTGQTAAQLLRERIVDPLNLHHTYFVPYEPAPATLVSGFDRDLAHVPGLLEIGAKDTAWATAAYTSGAFVSTAEDLGVFYDQLFAGALLSPPMMEEMTTFVDAPNPGFAEQTGYGLGLMRLEVDGQELIGHVGEFMGSTAFAMYSPSRRDLVVVVCDLSFPNLAGVVADLRRDLQ